MRIIGLACAVPKDESPIEEAIGRFPEEIVRKIIGNTGVHTRRIAPRGMSASDLSVRAAESLFEATGVAKDSVDAIIFVSQTGDYLTPTTSSLLQHRLGLPNTTFTFDLNKGCTGYTDGLIVAEGLLSGLRMNRVLLIVSDALSKMVDTEDQSTALLFGDAASATLLERDGHQISYVCGTDGSGFDAIHQNGGYRVWDTPDAYPIPFRSITSTIDGALVFEFTLKRIPSLVRDLLQNIDWSVEDVDAFVFHQANLFIMKHLARKLKVPMEKLPLSLDRFGNTSGASIPMTLVASMRETLNRPQRLVLVGFGVGLAWSAVSLSWSSSEIVLPMIEI